MSSLSRVFEDDDPEVVKKARKRKRKKDPFLKIPGIKKVTLNENTQKYLGCIAGQHVTIDNPWRFVQRDKIVELLDMHEESCEFLPIKTDIIKHPEKEIYLGYVIDDSKEQDDFYVCTVPETVKVVNDLTLKLKNEIYERMYNSIHRVAGEWQSLGSEVEVNEAAYKNNRPLIEVEVEAGYPISVLNKEFNKNKAEERRDGYMELRWNPEERISIVPKRRVHAYVQVAPLYNSQLVQTNLTYPTNASTQYHYEIGDINPLLARCIKPIKSYVAENMHHITDKLQVNSKINLYSEDYLSLIKDNTKFEKVIETDEVKEYMSLMDVDLCTEKMISDVAFHPMWTGTVAVAYNIQAPFIFQTGPKSDELAAKTVQGNSLVLIWSSLDGLKPKLILKAPREVIKLAFCKFDENVLLGGLRNGQIAIWDIRNKLQQVEECPILSPTQVKNRAYMFSLMNWMKIIHDISVVHPTVISDLKYSHKAPVTGIIWVSPFEEFTKLGRLVDLDEKSDYPYSMQFLTGAEDGSILIWDLMKQPTISAEGFKPRKLKRLKKRPSALMTDSSPFAVHNLNLRPIFKIIIPRLRKKPLAMASCSENLCPMDYIEANQVKNKKPPPLNERIIYKPILDRTRYNKIKPGVDIGSMEGDYIYCKWDGHEFDSGEIINCQFGEVMSRGRFHDSSLNTTMRNPEFDVTLTVGGRVFALWNTKLKNRPFFWRKSSQMYTSGEWNVSEPYLFTNKIMNGDVETWSVSADSTNPSFSLTFSSGCLSASAFHTLKQRKTIYAAADKLGCLRLFFMPDDPAPGTPEFKKEKFKHFIEREVTRKLLFLKWQQEWNERAAANEAAQKKIEDEKKEESAVAVVQGKVEEKSEPKEPKEGKAPKSSKLKHFTVTFIDKIIRQRQLREEACMKETIVVKKQLDTKELEKRRKPLQKLEEENERKKKKQRQRLKEGENIFLDTVSSLFPDVMKEKPPPPPDPYASNWVTKSLCDSTYVNFMKIKQATSKFIEEHPYNYEFQWHNILKAGKARRDILTDPTGEIAKAWHQRGSGRSLVSSYNATILDTRSVKSTVAEEV